MAVSGDACRRNMGIGIRSIHDCACLQQAGRWADKGVLERIFTALQEQRLITIRVECIGLDSTSIKVHPDAAGALKKTAHKPSENPEADGTPKFIWFLRMIERP